MKYEEITKEQLGQGSPIQLEIVPSEDAVYEHMANDMYEQIVANNAAGKNTVFIVPVGPVGQYRKLAAKCNENKVNLKNVWFFNMDEYLDDNDIPIPMSHPLSFEGFMYREFYDLMDDTLNIPKTQRIFPRPGNEDDILPLIESLGGVDTSYGGIGINGHIAFNEPTEDGVPMDNETFKNQTSRILNLTRETRTINAVTAANGFIDYIPKRCITIGMKEILCAKRIRFYMNRTWQKGIVRKILHGPVTYKVPASFFQEHPDAKLIIADYVAEPPVGQLR